MTKYVRVPEKEYLQLQKILTMVKQMLKKDRCYYVDTLTEKKRKLRKGSNLLNR